MMPQLHAPLKGISIKQSVTAIGRIRGLSNGVLQQEVNGILQKLDIRAPLKTPQKTYKMR